MPKYSICKGCPLENSFALVPKEETTPKKIMVVGESPTAADVRSRNPFASRTGQTLRKTIRETGLSSKDIYYTNAIKCVIPRDSKVDIGKVLKHCNIIDREIKHYKPKVIIGTGNICLRKFTGKQAGIVTVRGTPSKLDGGQMFIPTLTPKYVEINPNTISHQRRDIGLAQNMLKALSEGVKKNKYYVIRTPEQLKMVLKRMDKVEKILTYDIESTGLDEYTGTILGVGFSWKAHTGIYIPLNHRERLDLEIVCPNCKGTKESFPKNSKAKKPKLKKCYTCKGEGTILDCSPLAPFWDKKEEKLFLDWFRKLAKKKKRPMLTAHHIGFEHKWLKHKHEIDVSYVPSKITPNQLPCFDTQLYAYARDPFTGDKGQSTALGNLVSIYPDLANLKDIWKPIKKNDPHDLSRYYSLQTYGEYCAGDCDGTFRLAEKYLKELKSFKPNGISFYNLFYQRLMPTAFFISDMVHTGVNVDKKNWNTAYKELGRLEQEALDKILTTVYEGPKGTKSKVPEYFNPNSDVQMRKFCFDKMKFPMLRKPKKGTKKNSTDKKVLEAWQNQYHIVFASDMLEYRSANKTKEFLTQFRAFTNSVSGRLHADAKMWGTETGRLSWSKPPLQNTPSHGPNAPVLRAVLKARPGYMLLGADYSQIELRIIAWLSKELKLLNVYLNPKGVDVHTLTTSELFSVPFDEVTEDQRDIGKRSNFALCYGGSWKVLYEQLGNALIPGAKSSDIIPVERLMERAKFYHKRYHQTYPKVNKWAETCKEYARKHGYMYSLYGRIRNFPDIHSRNSYLKSKAENGAVNHGPQSTASDYLLFRFQDIIRAGHDAGIQIHPLVTIHDALYFEVEEKHIETASKIVETVGVIKDESNLGVPMVLDPKTGYTFAEL